MANDIAKLRIEGDSPVVRRGAAVLCRMGAALLALIVQPGCLVFVSTGPGAVTNANIVFIAVTRDGGLVAGLHVSVVSVDGGSWRREGSTAADGALRVAVGPGVTRVRASVTTPPGYAAAEPHRWPRDIDVRGEDLEVRVLVTPD